MHYLANSVVLGTDLKVYFIETHCMENYMALEEDTRERKRQCTLEGVIEQIRKQSGGLRQ